MYIFNESNFFPIFKNISTIMKKLKFSRFGDRSLSAFLWNGRSLDYKVYILEAHSYDTCTRSISLCLNVLSKEKTTFHRNIFLKMNKTSVREAVIVVELRLL